jgi:hypothetical protein
MLPRLPRPPPVRRSGGSASGRCGRHMCCSLRTTGAGIAAATAQWPLAPAHGVLTGRATSIATTAAAAARRSASSQAGGDSHSTHFGFREVPLTEKTGLVKEVFYEVAERYDIMNDFMSVGIHRLWKDEFIRQLCPQPGMKLLDLAGGTGDIAFRFAAAARANHTIPGLLGSAPRMAGNAAGTAATVRRHHSRPAPPLAAALKATGGSGPHRAAATRTAWRRNVAQSASPR